MEPESTSPPWGVNLSIAISVLGTVFVALLLAQLDTLRARLPLPATVIALVTQPILTETAVPTTPLPTATPTVSPPSPEPTSISSSGVTAVPMLPVCGEVPAGWISYIVQPGDSYFFLSANSGATITEIIQANCLDPNVLLSGIQIYLPAQPPIRPVCGPPTTWVRYIVQRGDTLFSLAQQRSTTVYAVMQANCLSSSYLQAERQIYLPPLPATITPFPTPVPPPTDEPPTAVPPTPTWTVVPPTAAPSPSATVTVTPQPSPTATTAASVTPSMTPTPSPITPTATMTATPSFSPTPTNMPPATATPTASNTPSPSPTSTELPTPSPSPTNTETPQPTTTPTDTPTPSPASGS